MPTWLVYALIAVATGVILALCGKTRQGMDRKNRQRFHDRYDPVRLQQQEAMEPLTRDPRRDSAKD